MLYYEDILFSLYEIKEYAESLNRKIKNKTIIIPNEFQDFPSRIIEHANTAIGEIKSVMTVEDLRIKKAFKEIHSRENTGEDEEEET